MKLDGTYVFDAPVAAVWSALFDPKVLAAVMPGCEKLDVVDGHYVGEMNIKVGPVQGHFSGVVDLKDVLEPASYTMVIDGRGGPGFVKATASVTLEAQNGGTLMHYDADAQVGGKIASIGQRLVDASARAIAKQSLEGLDENIKLRQAAARPVVALSAASALSAVAPPANDPAPSTAAAPTVDEVARAQVIATVVRTDPAKFAANVARDVGESLVPLEARYAFAAAVGAIVGGLGVYLLLRG